MDRQDLLRFAIKIEKIFTGESLTEAARYYGIDKREIVYTSINKSLIAGLTIGSSIFILHPLLGIALGVATLLATLSILLGRLPKRFAEERLEVERYGALFLETFTTTLISTESILKAVISVGRQGLPRISGKFRKIAKKIENGEDPEDLILRFSESLPSRTLKTAIRRMMSIELHQGPPLQEIVETTEREMRRYFESYTAQMESRITVIFAIDFFVPTVVMVSATMLGFARSPLILFLVPFHLCLMDIAQTKIARWGADLIW
ncbi:hypothetical protein ISS96_00470 [Candidatus Bathyarchaeota archaeon]|nr:hypothetical protein [Candidatus Bathyarchaeota archaeon]